MSESLVAKATITINAPASKVWEALTTPEWIKQYLFGTEAISDWKVGSSIIYKGSWEGKSYEDKGIILKMEPEKLLESTYLSSFSGLADMPENYSKISYELSAEDGQTKLSISQSNCPTEEARAHSEENWGMVLATLKKLLEKKS